jgi:hypothetical protein
LQRRFDDARQLGNVVSCTRNGTTYEIARAGCANGGTLVYDFAGTVTGCTLNDIPQTVIDGGCNNAGLVSVLNSDYTANPAYNGSPLICPIAETYTSLSQAAGGFLGAEFSRVVGGIHTPAAVVQALALGSAIGSFIVPVALTSAKLQRQLQRRLQRQCNRLGRAELRIDEPLRDQRERQRNRWQLRPRLHRGWQCYDLGQQCL